MPAKLKVFRTPIGFYDAYVAAPSRKAALEAWGSEKDLFASGRAELVEDPKLARPALASPGEVIKVARGTDEEHIAALPKAKPPRKKEASVEAAQPFVKPPPRPGRTALDRAEKALEVAQHARDTALDQLDQRIRSLQEQRRHVARRHDETIERLRRARDDRADAYDDAMRAWRGD